ncbi:ras-related protein Rab-37-like [Centruroides sculpturatus]|uniref:ras-related protein Rab-37-like n=1 Tax=Centruroides sculpturatus TaxID=218467 RepID=UPI000C6D517A|nr:ras-related protein Rab-37-like [Centruroides sculpturatus]
MYLGQLGKFDGYAFDVNAQRSRGISTFSPFITWEKAWLGEINEYAQDDVVIMLIGNKADVSAEREVKYEDGERLAKEYGVTFMETSAKTGMNVDLAFMAVAR